MGNRGPEPLTSEQLRIRGSHRAKARAESEAALQARIGPSIDDNPDVDRSAPPDFDKYAKYFWDEHVDDLIEAGFLTYRTYAGFVLVCVAWSDIYWAADVLTAEGLTCTGSRGQLKKHPAIAIRNEAFQIFTKLAKRFGITP